MDDVAFLLPENQGSATTATVLRLEARISAAIPLEAYDTIEEETLDYMLLPSSALPSVHREEGKPTKSTELCVYWQQVGGMTTLGGGPRFHNLSRLAKCILSLPVSNAETERVFSIVRKIITDYCTQWIKTHCVLLFHAS